MITQTNKEENEKFCRLVSYSPSVNFKAIKLEIDDIIWAIVGYDHWTPNAVQMHSWINPNIKRLNKGFIRECLRYPFEIGKRGLVIGVTPGDNAPALEFNRRIGFKEVYRIKDGWALGTDMVIQELRREACRWI